MPKRLQTPSRRSGQVQSQAVPRCLVTQPPPASCPQPLGAAVPGGSPAGWAGQAPRAWAGSRTEDKLCASGHPEGCPAAPKATERSSAGESSSCRLPAGSRGWKCRFLPSAAGQLSGRSLLEFLAGSSFADISQDGRRREGVCLLWYLNCSLEAATAPKAPPPRALLPPTQPPGEAAGDRTDHAAPSACLISHSHAGAGSFHLWPPAASFRLTAVAVKMRGLPQPQVSAEVRKLLSSAG